MIKSLIDGYREGMLINKTLKEKKYYESIEDLPIYNFFKIKKGEYKYLWKSEKDYEKKFPLSLFQKVFFDMHFQFKKMDNTYLRDLATLEDYRSKYVRTGLMRWKNEFNTLESKIKKTEYVDPNIDDFTNYIERVFNNPVGSLDVHKVSTSKAFSNYHIANEKMKDANTQQKRHI